MKTKLILGALALSGLSGVLAGCGSTGVFDRDRPDEFAVTRAEPLDVPQDLNTLPTPQPGTARQTGDSKQEVLDAMFGAPKQ
jgi:Protein of unknown function (DUF3035)